MRIIFSEKYPALFINKQKPSRFEIGQTCTKLIGDPKGIAAFEAAINLVCAIEDAIQEALENSDNNDCVEIVFPQPIGKLCLHRYTVTKHDVDEPEDDLNKIWLLVEKDAQFAIVNEWSYQRRNLRRRKGQFVVPLDDEALEDLKDKGTHLKEKPQTNDILPWVWG